MINLLNGDNIDLLKTLPDNSVDSVVTDPPYGLGKEPDIVQMMTNWTSQQNYNATGGGFMNKEWDSFVPQPLFWKEVFRVLKPGGHVLSFFGTRTYDLGVMAMRFAGFEIRDRIQYLFDDSEIKDEFYNSLDIEQQRQLSQILKNGDNEMFWTYATGFPKSASVPKMIEGKLVHGSSNTTAFKQLTGETRDVKIGLQKSAVEQGLKKTIYYETENGGKTIDNPEYTTDEAKEWIGWGTHLKPANEPIVLARKPLSEKTVAENVLKHNTGGINIDACRVGYVDETDFDSLSNNRLANRTKREGEVAKGFGLSPNGLKDTEQSPHGRFPANLIIQCTCDEVSYSNESVTAPFGTLLIGIDKTGTGVTPKFDDINNSNNFTTKEFNNIEHTNPDCPCNQFPDSQHGSHWPNAKTTGFGKYGDEHSKSKQTNGSSYLGVGPKEPANGKSSRFFFSAKASKSEKNIGLDDFEIKEVDTRTDTGKGSFVEKGIAPQQNSHPTVKPIALMEYLVKMITPVGGVCLDPFMGSGTTGIACVKNNFDFIGMELQDEYYKIANARIEHYKSNNTINSKTIIKKHKQPVTIKDDKLELISSKYF